MLTGTIVAAAVVSGLYLAKPVLMPVVLAALLAFLLAPVVKALQRWHIDRRLAIAVVVLVASLAIGGAGWVIKVELLSLAKGLPAYSENIQVKVQYARDLAGRAGGVRLVALLDDFTGPGKAPPADTSGERNSADRPAAEPAVPAATANTPPAMAVADGTVWQSRLLGFLSSAMASAAGVALALVLVIFMLLEREPLRNRLIGLMGNGRMTATTKALDDASNRIGRYLYTQFFLNSAYGVVWGGTLYLVGVDYAVLWGFLAAILRYIPYLGATLGALCPIALSLAQFPGWWPSLTVIAMVLVLELIFNNALEPWFYGQSIGVSPVGMLIAIACWTLLWGPIGLVLSGPLTICLVVLGKHVPGLAFFAALLGNTPTLDPDVIYYQRLLAHDHDEAAQLVLEHARASSGESVYDDLLVPALIFAGRDLERKLLTEADSESVFQATQDLLEDLGENKPALHPADATDIADQNPRPAPSKVHVVVCPARGRADQLGVEMLRQLLDPAKWEVEVSAPETLTAELVDRVAGARIAIICIGSLPPGGLAHTRYLCKRLRGRNPDLKIVVGRWGLAENVVENRESFEEAGADWMATSLLDARKQLNDWLPALVCKAANADSP